MTRTFPDPDPFERFLAPEEASDAFWALPQPERSLRLRLYLITRSALGPYFPLLNWQIALNPTPAGLSYAHDVVDVNTDEQITAMLRDSTAFWKQFQADVQVEPPVPAEA